MPTYEYECRKCGHAFEIFQSMTDKPKKRCPACKGNLRRLIGKGGGIIFKGPGFYATEYRSKDYEKKLQEETKTKKVKDKKPKDKKNKSKST